MAKKEGLEASLERLEEYARKMQSGELSLEEAIRCYEDGKKEYESCKEILEDAKQRIVTMEEDA